MRFVNYYRVEYEERNDGYIELFDTMEEAKEFYDELVEDMPYTSVSEAALYAGSELVESYTVDE